jgi:hypothetical protein
MRIFTKKFFNLSPIDQCKIIEAELQKCDEELARPLHYSDSRYDFYFNRVKARRKRIERKAIEFGIWDADPSGKR